MGVMPSIQPLQQPIMSAYSGIKSLFQEDPDLDVTQNILSSFFTLDPKGISTVRLSLTPTAVIYQSQEQPSKVFGFAISFDTVFQMLRPKYQPETKVLEAPYGIKFLCKGTQPLEFLNENQKELQRWEKQLKVMMNQFNFHELFKAEKKLGKGNFATVYLGTNFKTNTKVAIKAFGKASLSLDRGREALINEIAITRKLDHPNLMKMQGVYESQNSIYLVLEYIEGQRVCSRMNSLSKYTMQERRCILKSILRGLTEMAKKGVVHRDIKPDNIILGKQPIIIDFGLATEVEAEEYIFVRCGTPGYVAPEIINITDMTEKCHPISDVFSVGCIFYYILFGKHLFMAKNQQEIIAANKECNVDLSGAQFDKLNSKGSVAVDLEVDLLKHMLQKEPGMRIAAEHALQHAYFSNSDEKFYTPKILMKQSAGYPIDLLSNENEAKVKFITRVGKENKNEAVVKTYEKNSLKKRLEQMDFKNMLMASV